MSRYALKSIALACLGTLLVSACGGGGGGGGSNNNPNPNPGGGNNAGTAYDTKFTRTPFPGTRSSSASFEFAARQGASFECSLDGAAFAACTTPHTVDVTPGFHTLQVRSVINGAVDLTPARWRWEYVNDLNALASNESPFYNNGGQVPVVSDLGAFNTSCEAITTLAVSNDQLFTRNDEMTWSGVAIPRELALKDTANLVLVGPNERRVAAQFRPLSRWQSRMNDNTADIKWLEVAALTTINANSSSSYSLRYCASLPVVNDGNQITLNQQPNGNYQVDTGAAVFTLDPNHPLMLVQGDFGGNQIQAMSNTLDARSATDASPQVDTGSFTIEQQGPVKLVAKLRAHFGNLPNDANCPDAPGYVLRMTFYRGSGDVDLEYNLVNECGDGMFASAPGAATNGSDWWARILPVQSNLLSWNVTGMSGTPSLFGNTNASENMSIFTGSSNSIILLEQLPGAAPNVAGSDWRLARSNQHGNQEALELPLVAVSDASSSLMVQMPWMRFREPQALVAQVNPSSFSIAPVSPNSAPGTFDLGEAQGIWNFARISLIPSAQNSTQLFARAQQNQAAMERGLLWHAPVWFLNQTKVFPALPEPNVPEMQRWLALMDGAHDNTVTDSILGGAQRDRMKGYSLIGWPDIMQEGIKDVVNASLDEYTPGGNIWSPTNSELLMWFVTGDPKWAWDFALPTEWSFWHSNVYNTGSRGTVGIRNGYVIASAGVGPGARYRSGYGSDDKFYNQGSEKAYVIRPLQSLADRFQAAGETFIARYADDSANREDTVSRRVILRQVMQHVNALLLAGRYATGNNTALRTKLDSVMQEFVNDNLFGGTFCQSDSASTNNTQCAFAASGLFHYIALWQEVFYNHALDLDAADSNRQVIMNALIQTARLIDNGIPRDGNNTISDFSPTAWGNSYLCNLSSGNDLIQQCQQFNCAGLTNTQCSDPMYDNAHLNTLASVMVGHALDPGAVGGQRCGEIHNAFNLNLNGNTVGNHMRDSGFGWHKDSAQMSQMVLYGIAAAQGCP